jgi:hypothetical protein
MVLAISLSGSLLTSKIRDNNIKYSAKSIYLMKGVFMVFVKIKISVIRVRNKKMKDRFLERLLAVASFAVATALAFTSMLISQDNDIAANVLLAVAQFLTFAATILGIDYKLRPPSNSPEGEVE